MSLVTPEKIRKLQAALHAKAKGSPDLRFYSLYDKLYRADILEHAWRLCRANGGSAGVDGIGFERIEQEGVEGWLEELGSELREKTYRPGALLRVWIPKSTGGTRPLGIPRIKDRVVQTAALLLLEPIFEADLPDEQYGYRPGRGAHDAVRRIHSLLNQGYREVVDCDLSGYFDTIPHSRLMRSVARRVSDGSMLGLIKMWLEMPVEESEGRGGRKRTTLAKDSGQGTPQGAPISPLLSNLYMRRLVLGWKTLGWEKQLQARLVVYADDLVILCRRDAEQAREAIGRIVSKLGLKVNEQKTRVCQTPPGSFDFLGYTFGRCYSPRTGRAFIGTRPGRKQIRGICRRISEMTRPRSYGKSAESMVTDLNRTLRGWGAYFSLGPVSRAYDIVDNHARHRLRQWLNGKHRSRGVQPVRHAAVCLHRDWGLHRLRTSRNNLPWANA